MSVIIGRGDYGLYTNGQGELGDNSNFTSYSYYTSDALSGDSCLAMNVNRYGTGVQGNEFIPVDTSKYYQHSVSVRTITNNYNGNPGSGHLGFACYDKNKTFIDLRNCGDLGNTTLSRPASPGDSSIYITSASGWYTGDTASVTANRAFFRMILFFPATHPDYGQAHKYTRLNNRSYYQATLQPEGDWKIDLSSDTGSQTGTYTAATLPDYGYPLPAGTPVSRGAAGGSYNYCHGNPNYPSAWTTYTTSPFTGENRNSSLPFRYATKYIKFLNLCNYTYRSETSGDSATYLLDNIMLVEVPTPGIANDFFSITRRRRKLR